MWWWILPSSSISVVRYSSQMVKIYMICLLITRYLSCFLGVSIVTLRKWYILIYIYFDNSFKTPITTTWILPQSTVEHSKQNISTFKKLGTTILTIYLQCHQIDITILHYHLKYMAMLWIVLFCYPDYVELGKTW